MIYWDFDIGKWALLYWICPYYTSPCVRLQISVCIVCGVFAPCELYIFSVNVLFGQCKASVFRTNHGIYIVSWLTVQWCFHFLSFLKVIVFPEIITLHVLHLGSSHLVTVGASSWFGSSLEVNCALVKYRFRFFIWPLLIIKFSILACISTMNSVEKIDGVKKLNVDEMVPWEIRKLCELMNVIFTDVVNERVETFKKEKCNNSIIV